MCGIAGLWKFGGGAIDRRSFDHFVDTLQNRGPDSRGVWFDDSAGIALGHRRLAILDCSPDGHQPMGYSNGRYWIVFNGEIYNFLELKKELQDKGFSFRSKTDTEVILAAYALWGREALQRFNGMWALAIYDRSERELFMARDRFGIKPFLYQFDGRQFAFASELKAFKKLECYQAAIDFDTSRFLLANPMGVEGTSRTLLKGVQRLQGGHHAVLRDGRLTVQRWWKTLDHLVEPPSRPEEQAERFRELFEDAVRLRMRSDVSVGTSLSGGFDSTAVVCTLARLGRDGSGDRQARDWQQTFVATFPGAENDERASAELAIDYAGVKANFLEMDESYALREIDKVLYDFDDVFINLPTNAWMIYRQLRRHKVYVSLDGHGADELMGAYKPAEYILLHHAPHLLTHPGDNFRRLRESLSLMHTSRRPSTLPGRIGTAARLAWRHHPDFSPARALKKKCLAYRDQWLKGGARSFGETFRAVGSEDELPKHWGPVNRELYEMFHSSIMPTLLRNYDRVSMSHGIEIRMPFMDWRLACFVMSLPDTSKISPDQTKKVARDALKGLMPEAIRSSKVKIGFNSPLPMWFRGPLKDWVEDLLAEGKAGDAGPVDTARLRKFIRKRNDKGGWTWGQAEHAWLQVNFVWFARHFLKI